MKIKYLFCLLFIYNISYSQINKRQLHEELIASIYTIPNNFPLGIKIEKNRKFCESSSFYSTTEYATNFKGNSTFNFLVYYRFFYFKPNHDLRIFLNEKLNARFYFYPLLEYHDVEIQDRFSRSLNTGILIYERNRMANFKVSHILNRISPVNVRQGIQLDLEIDWMGIFDLVTEFHNRTFIVTWNSFNEYSFGVTKKRDYYNKYNYKYCLKYEKQDLFKGIVFSWGVVFQY